MNLALVGYGKMGRLIEQLAPSMASRVAAAPRRSTITPPAKASPRQTSRTSTPPSNSPRPMPPSANIERLAALASPPSCGTTGWLAQLDRCARRGRAATTRACLEPQLLDRRERLPARSSPRPRACSPTKPTTGLGLGNPPQRQERRALRHAAQLVDEMRSAGYARRIDVASNRAGSHPRHPRDRLRLRRRHHHPAPHRAQPRRLRARRAEGRQLDRRQTRASTNSARFCFGG